MDPLNPLLPSEISETSFTESLKSKATWVKIALVAGVVASLTIGLIAQFDPSIFHNIGTLSHQALACIEYTAFGTAGLLFVGLLLFAARNKIKGQKAKEAPKIDVKTQKKASVAASQIETKPQEKAPLQKMVNFGSIKDKIFFTDVSTPRLKVENLFHLTLTNPDTDKTALNNQSTSSPENTVIINYSDQVLIKGKAILLKDNKFVLYDGSQEALVVPMKDLKDGVLYYGHSSVLQAFDTNLAKEWQAISSRASTSDIRESLFHEKLAQKLHVTSLQSFLRRLKF